MKILNKRFDKIDRNSYYIGRGSKWGNPFTHIKDKKTKALYIVDTREEAIEKYRDWLLNNTILIHSLRELVGKDLVCYCAPLPCHGDILKELVEERFGEQD